MRCFNEAEARDSSETLRFVTPPKNVREIPAFGLPCRRLRAQPAQPLFISLANSDCLSWSRAVQLGLGGNEILTHMYGPAVRCKRFSSIPAMRSCINVSGL
jgi:hypothetical protein